MQIRLPTGEVTTVQLEYERLEKHCFKCFSLSHEERSCPLVSAAKDGDGRSLGLNQNRTLQNLEDDKRRQDSRRSYRQPPRSDVSRDRGEHSSYPQRGHHRHYSSSSYQRGKSHRSSGFRGEVRSGGRSATLRSPLRAPSQTENNSVYRNRPIHRSSSNREEYSAQLNALSGGSHRRQPSHLPSNRDRVEETPAASKVRSLPDQSGQSPLIQETEQVVIRASTREKAAVVSSSKARRPALERIPQYLGEPSQQAMCRGELLVGDCSKFGLPSPPPVPQDVEVRIPASLRLGSPIESVTITLPSKMPATKATRKRKVPAAKPVKPVIRSSTNTRGTRSPLKGTSLRKQAVTGTKISSRKKLRVDSLPETQAGPSSATLPDPLLPSLIPATCKSQSLLTRIWWDSKPDKRKMAWISWDNLTLPKIAGGLGFREIENFNDSLTISEEEVLLRAITDARSWMDAQALLPQPQMRSQSPAVPPIFPEAFTCFVDAAWSDKGFCGQGWYFQDTNKVMLFQKKASCSFVGSALFAETLALQSALVDAKSAGLQQLIVFSDCKVLISLLNSGNSIVELRGLLQDIRELSVSFTLIRFFFISRSSNVLADSLAKAALADVISSPPSGD
ncbi:unnamed protein product [Arabidopsis arenosa]|uniref:RNase H type-1 domain-containing protein n=1 Tax=Arabidopsis arenosa TaxID=38785 RepID=A0A8S2B630_ARAAE|nr:unnamed protein product [Arabidopsis arenosa]